MSRRGQPGPAGYARAIERRWSARIERAFVLSPREWTLVSEWYARGIPLELVVESMDAAVERRSTGRAKGPVRSLIYLAPAVEEAWAVVLAGRLRETDAPDDPPVARDTPEAWRRRRDREPPHSALATLLGQLLVRLEAGEPAERLDAELDRALPATLAPGDVAAVRTALERDLAVFRSRMIAGKYELTLERGVVERLRRRLELPRFGARSVC